MEEGLNIIINRLDDDGRIKADPKAPGLQHFRITRTNKVCPFNTYRVLKVLKKYKPDLYQSYMIK